MVKTQFKYRLLYFFIFVSYASLIGQYSPFYINYSTKNGLPSNTVYSINQDDKGKIWISTDEGISIYNGYDFETINITNGLPDNEIFNSFFDSKKRMWLLSSNGELSFIKNDEIYTKKNNHQLQKVQSNSLFSSIHELNGLIYVSSLKNGYWVIGEDSVEQLPATSAGTTNYIVTKNSNKFIVTYHGIYEDLDSILIPYFTNKYPRSFYDSSSNKIFCAFENKIIQVDIITGDIQPKELAPNADIIFCKKEENSLLIGTRKGLLFLNDSLEITEHIFKNLSITNYYTDRENNIWIGTEKNGLLFIPFYKMKNLTTDVALNSSESYYSLYVDKDKIIAGTNQGSYVIGNRNENNFKLKNEFTTSLKINNIHQDEFGNIWLVGKGGIQKIKKNTTKIYETWGNDIVILNNQIYIAENKFRVTTEDQITKSLLAKKQDLDLYRLLFNNDEVVKLNHYCFNLTTDYKNTVWVNTSKGIYSYNIKKKSISKLDLPSNHNINHILYDTSVHILYIASSTHGLISIKDGDKTPKLHQYLPSYINKVIYSDKGSFVLSESKLYFIPSSKKLFNLKKMGVSEKIQDIKINKDEIFVLTPSQLVSIPLFFDEYYDTTKPLLEIERIANSKRKFNQEDKIKIPYAQNTISIDYTGYYFKGNSSIEYQYKIEEIDNEWSVTKNRNITFKSLAPGKYTLLIKAINQFYIESESKTIEFIVLAPYWQKWWFILLVLISMFLFIFFFNKRRIKLKTKKLKIEKDNLILNNALLASEQKVKALQMNPHFLFNSLNTIKFFYLENKLNEADKYVNNLSKLLRKILNSDKEFITLEEEIEIITLYLKLLQNRYENIFNYKISCDIDESAYEIPPMLIQPFIENAIVKGISPNKKGDLNIVFSVLAESMIIKIIDDGVGISSKKEIDENDVHSTQIIKERLSLLEKKYHKECSLKIEYLDKTKRKGTIVTITIPLRKIF